MPLTLTAEGLALVPVTLGGGTHPFLLDTGFTDSALSSSLAEARGVTAALDDPIPARGISGAAVPARFGVLDELHVGELHIEDHTVMILEDDDLVLGELELAGVLGWPVFQHLRVEIDPRLEQVTFRRSFGPGGRPSNFHWLGEPFVRLTARDGSVLHFQLDTGMEGARLAAGLVPRLGLSGLAEQTERYTGMGGSREIVAQIVPEILLHTANVWITLRNISAFEGANEKLVRFDGCLGSVLLTLGKVVVDYPGRRLEIVLGEGDS